MRLLATGLYESRTTILLAACKTLGILKARDNCLDNIVFLRSCSELEQTRHFWTARPRSCTFSHECAPSGRVKAALPQASTSSCAHACDTRDDTRDT